MICGLGKPLAGVSVRVSGNRPVPAVVNDPESDVPGDGVASGGELVLYELTSALPDRLETPSEVICAVKFSEPSAVAAEKTEP